MANILLFFSLKNKSAILCFKHIHKLILYFMPTINFQNFLKKKWGHSGSTE